MANPFTQPCIHEDLAGAISLQSMTDLRRMTEWINFRISAAQKDPPLTPDSIESEHST